MMKLKLNFLITVPDKATECVLIQDFTEDMEDIQYRGMIEFE